MRFAPQAEADLREALQFIRDCNAQAAHKLGQRILAVLERLAAGDFEGQEQRLTTGEVVHGWPPVAVAGSADAVLDFAKRPLPRPSPARAGEGVRDRSADG